jgi:predicted nucleotidyltransferase
MSPVSEPGQASNRRCPADVRDPIPAASDGAAIIRRLRELLSCEADVRLAYLFGSMARGEGRPGSDADIAILWGRPPQSRWGAGDVVARLSAALGRSVDLADLSVASPALRMQVASDGVLLVERRPGDDLDFRCAAVRSFQDTARLRKVQDGCDLDRARERLGGGAR